MLEWYYQFSQFLSLISQPFTSLYYSQQVPLIGALLLGIIGSLAPCQVSANLGAISYTMNRMAKGEKWYQEMLSFFLGKTLVYFLLGVLVIWVGKGLEVSTIPVFQVTKKLIGPFFLITGLYFIGVIRIKGIFTERLLKYRGLVEKWSGNKQGFLLGILLSLAFCPTMFLLFFGLLIPLVLNTSGYGVTLPFIFSLGTSIPILIVLGLIFGFGLDKSLSKNIKQIGRKVQIISGVIFILVGINDIFLYW